MKTIIKKIKRKIFTQIIKKKAVECGINLKVNHWSKINENTIIKNNVNFNGIRIVGKGRAVIGNNFHSGVECMLITLNHNYEGTQLPYDSENICKEIIIEDNVWIENRVIILGGGVLGEGCIIQAGSVVSGKIPSCAIAGGGNPAMVFKYRDKEHYETIKENGVFH